MSAEQPFHVPTPEQIARRAPNFEAALRDDIYRSQKNLWMNGGGRSPWETVAAYVVALEKRVKELESK